MFSVNVMSVHVYHPNVHQQNDTDFVFKVPIMLWKPYLFDVIR